MTAAIAPADAPETDCRRWEVLVALVASWLSAGNFGTTSPFVSSSIAARAPKYAKNPKNAGAKLMWNPSGWDKNSRRVGMGVTVTIVARSSTRFFFVVDIMTLAVGSRKRKAKIP